MVHRGDVSAAMPDPGRRRATVRARGNGSGSRPGDRVTRRGVRNHVGQRADRDERARGHPSVHTGEAGNSHVARNLCSVAPHP
jgi:hypothetical protein